MAHRRMIDPSAFSNPALNSLEPADWQLAIGLVCASDDDTGRGPVEGRWVRNQVLQFSEENAAEIERRLERIARVLTLRDVFPGRLHIYEVDGRRYYQWLDWAMWQSLDNPVSAFPPPPGYHWVPDTSDKRRKTAGRWEPESDCPPRGSADLPAEAPPVPSGAQAQSSTSAGPMEQKPKAEPQQTVGYPDGYAQLSQCHQQHSVRSVTTDDTAQLLTILREAAEAGVEWQALLTIMRETQVKFKRQKPNEIIKYIGYYCRPWREHIAAAKAERESRVQDEREDEQEAEPVNPWAARAQAQAAALLRGDAHGQA